MSETLVVAALAVALLAWLILRRPGHAQVDTFYDLSDGER